MKFNSPLFATLVLAASAALHAAPLAETLPVYAKPDATAPVIGSAKAGTEPAVATGVEAPAGWTAVTLAGPHEVFAANKDVTKSLEVRPGSAYLLEGKSGAATLALAEKGDQAEIIDYKGKYTKFRLSKPVTGYIKLAAKPAAAVAATPAAPTIGSIADSSAPTASPAQTPVPVGKPAPTGDGGSSALPRLFQGKFASTYNPLRPRRPYDFQLNDDAGARYAYVDVSKLLATEQLNKFLDRTVVVYGTAKPIGTGKEMVIVAESLQLR